MKNNIIRNFPSKKSIEELPPRYTIFDFDKYDEIKKTPINPFTHRDQLSSKFGR